RAGLFARRPFLVRDLGLPLGGRRGPGARLAGGDGPGGKTTPAARAPRPGGQRYPARRRGRAGSPRRCPAARQSALRRCSAPDDGKRDTAAANSRTLTMRLITIPISHYCDRARWGLELAGVPYREERHVQMLHRLALRRAGAGHTVPVLIADGEMLTDSADIL